MHLPFVIDNQKHKLSDVLQELLGSDKVHALDIASAYFNIGGFALLQEQLSALASFRLLLGAEPGRGEDIGLHIKRDLDAQDYNPETLRLVEDLIAFLRKDWVSVRLFAHGFLHAKSYLCFADQLLGDRFQPVAGIVGSSNFTRAGLSLNKELNLTHKTILFGEEIIDPEAHATVVPMLGFSPESWESIAEEAQQSIKSEVGARAILELLNWYDNRWGESEDYKEELIALLDESKFGNYEYSPYEIYLKALYEYFKDQLGEEDLEPAGTRSAIDLTEFQGDAVQKARRILEKYDGVMIADSVGLGKTWIGKKLLEDYAYHKRQKALVICPASLREMWKKELRESTIPGDVISQESMGIQQFDPRTYRDVDVILIDESHNFRNQNSNRYESLERVIAGRGGRGRSGERKKVILLTATPINNTILDLYSQVTLITQNDNKYFAPVGISDLRKFFLSAERGRENFNGNQMVAIFNLLEEVVVRRTRTFIRQNYPKATIGDKEIQWPERKLRTVRYSLEDTYSGLYDRVVGAIDQLNLSPYSLEEYKKADLERDELELGREQALVGIFKTRFLKRFESSVEAFRISIRRALAFQKAFIVLLESGKLLDSSSFREALKYLNLDDEDDDRVVARVKQISEENIGEYFSGLPELYKDSYDLRKLHQAVENDITILENILQWIEGITPEKDAKLTVLKDILSNELKGEKVLIFTYYRDTAQYVFRELENDERFLSRAGCPRISRLDGDIAPNDRTGRIARFAPKANDRDYLAGSEKEIDIMVSTDVLSEGQNLQDCGHLLNYDLHWNPTRMVQRAGRIDRIGSAFETLWVYNVFPEEELEKLLGLVERLNIKIRTIDDAGLLETSVLGEAVHPRNFNTLQRIADEDENVIDEQEAQSELFSTEFLLAALKQVLVSSDYNPETLPDGIHSGRQKEECKGLFFYFTAPPTDESGLKRHFWRYYDVSTGGITENRYEIIRLIQCEPTEPRVQGSVNAFTIQEKVIEDILESVVGEQAGEIIPSRIDPIQQQVRAWLQNQLENPEIPSEKVREALKKLSDPLPNPYIKDLKDGIQGSQKKSDPNILFEIIANLDVGISQPRNSEKVMHRLTKEDLHLVCWEYVWS
jgi:superfamily II DNA/RNA helicase